VPFLRGLGAAAVVLEGPQLARDVRHLHADGGDAVLDLVGNSVVLESVGLVRRGGRVCLAGFLGGLAPLPTFDPLRQMPSGVHWSFFGSFVFGTPGFPVAGVPFQAIVDRVGAGRPACSASRRFARRIV